ncbi:hypothetical protein San01_36390 [Streptomyces angustmyceticus]|uniref:Uncharacterized protein n=1 Tax=Streptomyces angustmyceticus TaxID=285578 RepID=A0A5J4LGE4_9ACTN|nr:hypothetical protein San01_36390 [Streptomyces angustmyceticus]
MACNTLIRGREDGCRNNATGLLLSRHIRQHRWQKLNMLILRRQVRPFCSGLFTDDKVALGAPAVTGGFSPVTKARW